jgi:acyl carrier protein
MEIHEFIGNLKEQFEEIDTSNFEAKTEFKFNDEYSSLTGMSIIAMVDEKYNVTLTGNDLRKASTIEELFFLVKSKRVL